MATPDAVVQGSPYDFTHSTHLVGENPSAPDRQPATDHDYERSPKGSLHVDRDNRPKSKHPRGFTEPTWGVRPPTAPRSMRRKITPPPLRRADTYRPSEDRSQYDAYRAPRRRYSGDFGFNNRAAASDRYRPRSPRNGDGFRDEERTRSGPRDGDDHPPEESAHAQHETKSKNLIPQIRKVKTLSNTAEGGIEYTKQDSGGKLDPRSSNGVPETSDRAQEKRLGYGRAAALSRFYKSEANMKREMSDGDESSQHKQVDDKGCQNGGQSTTLLPKDQAHDSVEHDLVMNDESVVSPDVARSENDFESIRKRICDAEEALKVCESNYQMYKDHNILLTPRLLKSTNDAVVQMRAKVEALKEELEHGIGRRDRERTRPGLASTTDLNTGETPPHPSFPQPNLNDGLLDHRRIILNQDLLEHGECVPLGSTENDTLTATSETIVLKGLMEITTSPASRLSNEETASTSSTTTSRSKHLCRACGRAGSIVIPLVSCKICRKGYHDRCGTPPPRHSENHEHFVCGRCLKKQERETVSKAEPRGSSLDHYSPPDAIPDLAPPAANSDILTPLELPAAGREANKDPTNNTSNTQRSPNMGQRISSLPLYPSSPATNVRKPAGTPLASDRAIQGKLYKHITCPRWKYNRCFLIEAHCLFAHRNTGQDAPGSFGPAKAFTCPRWQQGVCVMGEQRCHFTHQDTGLYVGPGNHAALKHITCYYWKLTGHCRKEEDECLYAHEDTGILALQPVRESQNRPWVNSLKDYICPRWEANSECRWGYECAYSHSRSGKSCLELERQSRPANPRDSDSRDGSLPLETTTEDFPKPPWAESVRQNNPISIIKTPNSVEGSLPMINGNQDQFVAPSVKDYAQAPPRLPDAAQASSTMQVLTQQPPREHSPTKQPRTNKTSTPIKHTARRSKISYDPRKRKSTSNTEGAHPTTPGTGMCQSADLPESSSNPDAAAIVSPLKVTTLTNSTGTVGKKQCEHCGKAIFTATTSCKKCFNSGSHDETTDLTNPKTVLDGAARLSNPSSASAEAESQDILDLVEADMENNAHQSKMPDSILQQPVVAKTLKRAAADDNLFVARKKPKVAQMSIDAMTQSLLQENRKVSIPVSGRSTSQSPFSPRRGSLDELTRLALLEKKRSSSGIMAASTSPIPPEEQHRIDEARKAPTEDSLDPSSHPQGTSIVSSAKSPGNRDRSISATSPQPDYDIEAEVPNVRPSADPESSSVDDTDCPTPPEQLIETLITEDNFTEEEHALFTEAYVRNPKAWGKIAESLPGRNHEDCVQHYYTTKKYFNYKRLVKNNMSRDPHRSLKLRQAAKTSAECADSDKHLLNTKFTSRDIENLSLGQENRPTEQDVDKISAGETTRGNPTVRTGEESPDPITSNSAAHQVQSLHPQSVAQSNGLANGARELQSPISFHRCDECTRDHKRCLHGLDGSLDPEKCAKSIEENNNECSTNHNVSTEEWGLSVNAACLDLDQQVSTEARHDPLCMPRCEIDMNQLAECRDYLSLGHATATMEESDEDDPFIQIPTSFTLGQSVMTETSSLSEIESNSRLRGDINRPSYSSLSSASPSEQTDQSAKIRDNGSQVPRPLGATETELHAWTKEDEAHAIARLRARGVMFEPDPNSDEDMTDAPFEQPRHRHVDPLWRRPQKSFDLFEVDPSLQLIEGDGLPRQKQAPTMKQLIGHLLEYQCQKRRKEFGDPHQEVSRIVEDVEVEVVVQHQSQQPLDLWEPNVESRATTMGFREFVGIPQTPVVSLGSKREEVIFKEGNDARPRSANGSTRARRVLEEDKFPFIYPK